MSDALPDVVHIGRSSQIGPGSHRARSALSSLTAMNTHSPLAAIGVHRNETLLFFTLLQLTVIVAAGRLGEVLAIRCRQAPVVGAIIAGILIGP
jgi:hypothetical protein